MNNPYAESLKPLWRNEDRKDVFVDEEKLEELAEKMRGEELTVPAWNVPNVHPPMDCDLAPWLNFICWINTVNFAFTNFEPPYNKFTKFTVEYPAGTTWNGAFAMQASFMRALREGIPVTDAKYMSKVSVKDVKYIFRSINKEHQIPMLRERWQIFHEVGRVLLEKSPHRGDEWFDLFSQGHFRTFNNGGGIVELLTANFPSFLDVRSYKGHILEFHKRAQLLVMMYHDRALHSGGRFPPIKDAEKLGPPCDYDVPKALEFLGPLKYSERLKDRIDNRVILPENSREEIEIRTATWYAMQRLCEILNTWIGPVDFYVWNAGRQSKGNHHLTPTAAY